MRVCVFCSSSSAVPAAYWQAALDLGTEIGARGHSLVFGGAKVGLMGQVARAASAAGSRVTGVIPRSLNRRDVADERADETILTDSLAERKNTMIALAEAFVALPGGFGTLDELLEVLTLKQLGELNVPVVLLNTEAYYAPLLAFFEQFYARSFAREAFRGLYQVAESAGEALHLVENYQPFKVPAKWFEVRA
ncbi:MAG: TIGR00730 family Rossman fold protein [Anaerolineae bacterium]|nr:TIGR00730 family Rossman fold protein [Chloroflexota bacterium]